MPLADILLITSGLLLLAMIAASICRHLPIPYTVLLVLLGLAVNFLGADSNIIDLLDFREFHLTPDLVLFVFLPALVFETALSLRCARFIKKPDTCTGFSHYWYVGISRSRWCWYLVVFRVAIACRIIIR